MCLVLLRDCSSSPEDKDLFSDYYRSAIFLHRERLVLRTEMLLCVCLLLLSNCSSTVLKMRTSSVTTTSVPSSCTEGGWCYGQRGYVCVLYYSSTVLKTRTLSTTTTTVPSSCTERGWCCRQRGCYVCVLYYFVIVPPQS